MEWCRPCVPEGYRALLGREWEERRGNVAQRPATQILRFWGLRHCGLRILWGAFSGRAQCFSCVGGREREFCSRIHL